MKQVFFLLVLCGALWGQSQGNGDVDQEELRRFGNAGIEFINYVGPHDSIDTVESIRNIGQTLARRVDSTGQFTLNNKYRVVHIVDPDLRVGLDADIFILEPAAAVDHIDNLRLIIAGYLESVYGYNAQDAEVIAKFATYYNAVYRGDADMVRQRYKPAVANFLEPSIIGIDRHYSNWPGKTQIIIPVRYTFGESTSLVVDTLAITEKPVIDEIKKKSDRGIPEREAIVDIIERQAEKEKSSSDSRTARAKANDNASGQNAKAGTLAGKENRNNQKNQKLEGEKAVKKQIEKALLLRDDIAKDKNELLFPKKAQSPQKINQEPAWLLHVDSLSDGVPYGRVIKYNLFDGEKLVVSPVTSVRGRQIIKLSDSILAIAGKQGQGTSVRPVLLDADSLELLVEGKDDIFPGSLISARGSEIYLITSQSGHWYLGRFDSTLKRRALSSIPVDPWTSISFVKEYILVQGESGSVVILSSANLQEVKN